MEENSATGARPPPLRQSLNPVEKTRQKVPKSKDKFPAVRAARWQARHTRRGWLPTPHRTLTRRQQTPTSPGTYAGGMSVRCTASVRSATQPGCPATRPVLPEARAAPGAAQAASARGCFTQPAAGQRRRATPRRDGKKRPTASAGGHARLPACPRKPRQLCATGTRAVK